MASLEDKRTKGYTGAKPWQVRYRDHTGKQRAEAFTIKPDATARLRAVQSAEDTGRLDLLDAGKVTLRDRGKLFVDLNPRDWSTVTDYQHRKTWNAYVHDTDLARMELRAIRASSVQAWKVDAQNAGVPEGSIRKALGLISQVLDHAALDDVIPSNPARSVKRPSGARKGDVIVTAPDGVEAIRRRLNGRDAAIVSVLAYAGLRPEELRALHWRHVGAKVLRLEYALEADGSERQLKGDGGERRSVPICAALAADLTAYRAGADDAALIFPFVPVGRTDRATGGPMTKEDWARWRDGAFRAAREAAGARITRPYDLRHSIGSLWLREGADSVTVARRLGHSVAVLYANYAHVLDDLEDDDRRTVDQMIAEARRPRA